VATCDDLWQPVTARTDERWVSQQRLGSFFGISARSIARLKASGHLKPGQHWRYRTPGSNIPVYDLEACDAASRDWIPSEPLLEAFDASTQK